MTDELKRISELFSQRTAEERAFLLSEFKKQAREAGSRRTTLWEKSYDALQEVATANGVSVSEVYPSNSFMERRQFRDGYFQHPDDPTKKAPGTGRRPSWVKEQLKNGRTLPDLWRPNSSIA